jgi:hypothetical protein
VMVTALGREIRLSGSADRRFLFFDFVSPRIKDQVSVCSRIMSGRVPSSRVVSTQKSSLFLPAPASRRGSLCGTRKKIADNFFPSPVLSPVRHTAHPVAVVGRLF